MFIARTSCLLLLFSSSLLQAANSEERVRQRTVGRQEFIPESSLYYQQMLTRVESYNDPSFLTSFREQYLSDEDTRTLVRSIPLQVSVNLLSLFAGVQLDPSTVATVIHSYGAAVAALKIPHHATSLYTYNTTFDNHDNPGPFWKTCIAGGSLCQSAIPSEVHWNALKTIGKHGLIYYNLPLGAAVQLIDMYVSYSALDGTNLGKLKQLNVAEFLENRILHKLHASRHFSDMEYTERRIVLSHIINTRRAEHLNELKFYKAE